MGNLRYFEATLTSYHCSIWNQQRRLDLTDMPQKFQEWWDLKSSQLVLVGANLGLHSRITLVLVIHVHQNKLRDQYSIAATRHFAMWSWVESLFFRPIFLTPILNVWKKHLKILRSCIYSCGTPARQESNHIRISPFAQFVYITGYEHFVELISKGPNSNQPSSPPNCDVWFLVADILKI